MQDDNIDGRLKYEWNFEQNEQIQQIYRSHWDVSVFDGQFIKRVLKESADIKIEECVWECVGHQVWW